jgi:chromate reductase, NAD(P)H dehydrogenase (quinone)
MEVRILALAGSIISTCFNKRLLDLSIQAAREEGAHVTFVDLLEDRFPHFSFDDEAKSGLPPIAETVKKHLKTHQGLLVAAPEFNGSFCTTLKAAIDWCNRPDPNKNPELGDFQGMIGAILSGSKWDHAGLRGLGHLRTVLASVGVTLIPDTVSLPHAREAFTPEWETKDPFYGEEARKMGRALVHTIRNFQPVGGLS